MVEFSIIYKLIHVCILHAKYALKMILISKHKSEVENGPTVKACFW